MTVSVALWPADSQEENEWDYALRNLRPDTIYLMGPYVGKNNVLRGAPHIDTFADLPEGEIVLLAPQTARNFVPTVALPDFVHPETATYIFGPNNQHLTLEHTGGRDVDYIVCIPTDSTDGMFNYASYLVTMWDRRHG
jgi:hypothetical protein